MDKNITRYGYGTATYPQSIKKIVSKLMVNFNDFCNQPLDHKMNMLFQKSMGYENRDRTINPTSVDHKESFYIKSNYEFSDTFSPTSIDQSFVISCKILLDNVAPLIEEATRRLSKIAGIDLSQYFDKTSFTLRAIHYYPDPSVEIAHHHVDRGGQTYHLFETTDGLETYWNNSWDKVIFDENEMAFFPGIQAQYASKCKIKGLCHRVVSNEESEKNGRFSLVLFVEYNKLPYKYSMNKRGPIEKAFGPGQNYEISYEELEDYFEEKQTLA